MNHAGIPLVVRSTVPPGLPQLIQRTGLSSATVFANPEFLRQGRAFEDFQNPDRVVVGAALARSSIALGLVVDLLTVPGVTLLVVSIEEAGLIKTASNAYLALRLAFANEVAMLCEQTGADVGQVLGGMKLDPRIGRQFLDPGYGFGGSCLPKDVSSLAVSGASLGIDMQLMTAITRANKLQTTWFARRIASELRPGCRRVALLGLAFKAGTDDVRGSPSLRLARLLLESGISVVGYDPVAGGHARQAFAGMEVVDSIEAAVAGADAAVIGTGWSVFSTMDWGPLVNIMRRPLIFDGRRVLDPSSMRALGFEYIGVGRGTHVAT